LRCPQSRTNARAPPVSPAAHAVAPSADSSMTARSAGARRCARAVCSGRASMMTRFMPRSCPTDKGAWGESRTGLAAHRACTSFLTLFGTAGSRRPDAPLPPLGPIVELSARAPCVTAAPARSAAARNAASMTSSRVAPACLAFLVWTSRQYGHCVVHATARAISSRHLRGIFPSSRPTIASSSTKPLNSAGALVCNATSQPPSPFSRCTSLLR
jgi:hypothetical protein